MLKKTLFFVLLVSLVFTSGSHAQYRWHIVHEDRRDTFYYGFSDISCSGENCSVAGYVWGYDTTKPLFSRTMPDSNFILQSTDGGETWNSIDTTPPHWTPGKTANILLNGIDQIDSLNAVAVGTHNTIIHTFDGWKTWHADTGLHTPQDHGASENFILDYPDFANAGEGQISDIGYGYSLSTVDTGKHWVLRHYGGVTKSYGNGMFRSFIAPNTIYTTHDNWSTSDTTHMTLDGPFLDTAVHVYSLMYGIGDTLAFLGYRMDSDDIYANVMMARSTDLGAHWSELPIPRTSKFDPMYGVRSTPINAQTIVITGQDSVGRIVISTDRGATWEVDTVPLDNGKSYFTILTAGVSGSGRVTAGITMNSNFQGSRLLAYLEKIPSSVSTPEISHETFTIFPNPATNQIQITSSDGSISISDPLGRSYEVKRNGNTLDISSLPPGVYFVSDGGRTNGVPSRAKFVKE